jgi:hypothetical protein
MGCLKDGANNNSCYSVYACAHTNQAHGVCFLFFFYPSLLFIGCLTTEICLFVSSRQDFLFGILHEFFSSRENAGGQVYRCGPIRRRITSQSHCNWKEEQKSNKGNKGEEIERIM